MELSAARHTAVPPPSPASLLRYSGRASRTRTENAVDVCNGLHGGFVATTSECSLIDPWAAIVCRFVSAWVLIEFNALAARLKYKDPLEATESARDLHVLVKILCKLSATAGSPSDLVSVTLTCKRLKGLGWNPLVLAKASLKSLVIKAKNWSDSAHKFLKQCADSGNIEACYVLGMNRGSGAALMARAAMASHAAALYSLAVIQFHGSRGSKGDKDLHAGVALCAHAAFLGHVDASGARPLPPGRLWSPTGRRRGPAIPCPGQRPRASIRSQVLIRLPCSLAVESQPPPHPASGCSLLSDYGSFSQPPPL
ncbi:hypothetical protein ZIOFF_041462 [Zingiber officinale]|uniref:F-box protein n=1 Tax=Zingiber officinale TaxID=94328 RepID=A0A8J5KYT4_ZINOF|nr:hypothetical protein ZIOFF_041462 [Zingiber officinale]